MSSSQSGRQAEGLPEIRLLAPPVLWPLGCPRTEVCPVQAPGHERGGGRPGPLRLIPQLHGPQPAASLLFGTRFLCGGDLPGGRGRRVWSPGPQAPSCVHVEPAQPRGL